MTAEKNDDVLVDISNSIKHHDIKNVEMLKRKFSEHEMMHSIIATHKWEMRRYASTQKFKLQADYTATYIIDLIQKHVSNGKPTQITHSQVKRQLVKIGIIDIHYFFVVIAILFLIVNATLLYFKFGMDIASGYYFAITGAQIGLYILSIGLLADSKFRLYSITGGDI